MQFDNDMLHSMWVFTGGAILVLLQSILSGAKRNWWSLLIGCALGGAGAWLAGSIWGDSKYVYVICGVAAVVTENMLIGVVNVSKEFADKPVQTLGRVWMTLAPSWAKPSGASIDIEIKDRSE